MSQNGLLSVRAVPLPWDKLTLKTVVTAQSWRRQQTEWPKLHRLKEALIDNYRRQSICHRRLWALYLSIPVLLPRSSSAHTFAGVSPCRPENETQCPAPLRWGQTAEAWRLAVAALLGHCRAHIARDNPEKIHPPYNLGERHPGLMDIYSNKAPWLWNKARSRYDGVRRAKIKTNSSSNQHEFT